MGVGEAPPVGGIKMAFLFDTDNGSTYYVENGRITREFWIDRDENGVGTIERERGRVVRPVRIGERATIELLDRSGSERFVTTSRVEFIVTVPAVRKATTVLGRPIGERVHNASDPLTPAQAERVLAMLANLR